MLPASIADSPVPGTDDGVQLVDERDDLAGGALDLFQDGLQPLFELAAVLARRRPSRPGRGDQRSCRAATRGRRRRRCAGPALRRSRSCRRRVHRSAPGCSWSGGDSTCTTRRISVSRPMTGSSLPSRAVRVRSVRVLLQRLIGAFRVGGGHAGGCRGPRRTRPAAPGRSRRASDSSLATSESPLARPTTRCSVETYSSLSSLASC